MKRRIRLLGFALLAWLAATDAVAQAVTAPAAQAPAPAASEAGSTASNLWVTIGTAFSTQRGDCQTCEEDFPYRHAAGLLANAGYRVNPRMNVGAEFFWVPSETDFGTLNSTHVDAVAQFRPWATK